MWNIVRILTLQASTPQIGQTHSTIRRLLPKNYLSVFDHFVGLVLKGLKRPVIFILSKSRIEKWESKECLCNLFLPYISNLRDHALFYIWMSFIFELVFLYWLFCWKSLNSLFIGCFKKELQIWHSKKQFFLWIKETTIK